MSRTSAARGVEWSPIAVRPAICENPAPIGDPFHQGKAGWRERFSHLSSAAEEFEETGGRSVAGDGSEGV
ncbi:hypothetical protein Pan44_19580 [Caulifigura coniformis]|uniref:Uncharacterized protein n=1 Tax=Caulifigura coniformis TaxID=2527983 RepID=A0A517SCT1_9PLAN|nr:hypothetical protein Pan44_19580 [Caulifigura coniformis]